MESDKILAMQNLHIVGQCVEVLEAIDPELYSRSILGSRAGSLGGQFRHCIDYMACFLRDLPTGKIDYDRRKRDPELERLPGSAADRLREISRGLAAIPASQAGKQVMVKADQMGEGAHDDPSSEWCASTLLRELRFLLSHTVHHCALISLMLKAEGVDVSEVFGVAPSTLEYWKDNPLCAR